MCLSTTWEFDSVCVRQSPRVCIPNRFPCDADVAGPDTPLWRVRVMSPHLLHSGSNGRVIISVKMGALASF